MIATRDQLQRTHGLTRRQAEITILLGMGRSNPEIAADLCISGHTVRHHVEQVLRKLNLRSRAQVAAMVLQSSAVSHSPSNERAHDLCLRGRFELHRRGNHLRDGIAYFEAAVVADPCSGAARGALAFAIALACMHAVLDAALHGRRAVEEAEHALRIDPLVADAHVALGFMALDGDDAERHLRRSLELNPSHATALNRLAQVLAYQGRLEEALSAAGQALDLDPASAMHRAVRGRVRFWCRRFEEAEDDLREAVRMDPDLRIARNWLGRLLEVTGRCAEACAEIARSRPGAKLDPREEETLLLARRDPSRRPAALEILRRLHAEGTLTTVETCLTAAHLELKDLALPLLAECIDRQILSTDPVGPYAWLDPRLDPVREDPRFRPLLWRITPPAAHAR
jgi:DNA-binding CsgD family transcriptional regulator/Flp pilus assembly protein TadD